MPDAVSVEVDGGVAVITINRPTARNAVNEAVARGAAAGPLPPRNGDRAHRRARPGGTAAPGGPDQRAGAGGGGARGGPGPGRQGGGQRPARGGGDETYHCGVGRLAQRGGVRPAERDQRA